MNKKILIAIVVVLAAAGIFLLLPRNKNSNSAPDDTTESIIKNPSDGGSGEQAGLPTYTKEQVAAHKTKTDCWTIVNGSVYNLTSFIPRHPGGDEILRACGIDSTSYFTQRESPEGEKVGSGTPHSSTASAELARLKIGELAE
jgi:hypothetical protein